MAGAFRRRHAGGAGTRVSAFHVSRWVNTAIVPLMFALNVGFYLLNLWLAGATLDGHTAPDDAWRIVTVLILVSLQAFWLVWVRKQVIGTTVSSLVLWWAALLVGGYDALAMQPGVLLALFVFSAERSGVRRAAGLVVAFLFTVAACLAAYAIHAPPGSLTWSEPPVLVSWVLAAGATIGIPSIIGAWYAGLRDRAERIADLAQLTASGEALRTAEAVSAERRTLAQDIHDTSSAHLTAIIALSTAAERMVESPELARVVGQIKENSRSLYQGYERMLGSLQQEDRTVAGTHQAGFRPGQHSIAEVPALVEEFRRASSIRAEVRTEPELAEIEHLLGPMRSHTAFRVVQEALNNVRKHSPGSSISITIEDDGESLFIRVENSAPDGVPESPEDDARPGLRLGISGLRDRLLTIGGSLRTGPRQAGGWALQALLPHPPHRKRGPQDGTGFTGRIESESGDVPTRPPRTYTPARTRATAHLPATPSATQGALL